MKRVKQCSSSSIDFVIAWPRGGRVLGLFGPPQSMPSAQHLVVDNLYVFRFSSISLYPVPLVCELSVSVSPSQRTKKVVGLLWLLLQKLQRLLPRMRSDVHLIFQWCSEHTHSYIHVD